MDLDLDCFTEGQDLLEWIIFLTGVVYVVLAARNKPQCWIWGIISCAILSYVSFTRYLLYADGLLQIIYVLLGILGIYQWRTHQEIPERELSTLTIQTHALILSGGSILAVGSGYLLHTYSAAFAGYTDAMTTVFGLIATVMLIYKIKENWLYWICIDMTMVVLYFIRGGCLTAVLYLIFTMTAIYGWISWNKMAKPSRKIKKAVP